MPSRNHVLLAGLLLFLFGYVSLWAYQTFYAGPRKKLGDEIAQLSGEIQTGRQNLQVMTQFFEQNTGLYYRSLPRKQNAATSYYIYWLYEVLQYNGYDAPVVRSGSLARPLMGADYQFTIQCTGSLSQLTNFLFEFYYAPFLHRITSMTLTPVDGKTEKMKLFITVNALALRPHQPEDMYPLTEQLPVNVGWHQRLASNNLETYQSIATRNLLQTAKGGIDKADFTRLTGITQTGNQMEVWFSVQTDDSVLKVKLGDSIHSGSFSGKVVEILDYTDIVLERADGSRWLLEYGESLKEAFALPPETAVPEITREE